MDLYHSRDHTWRGLRRGNHSNMFVPMSSHQHQPFLLYLSFPSCFLFFPFWSSWKLSHCHDLEDHVTSWLSQDSHDGIKYSYLYWEFNQLLMSLWFCVDSIETSGGWSSGSLLLQTRHEALPWRGSHTSTGTSESSSSGSLERTSSLQSTFVTKKKWGSPRFWSGHFCLDPILWDFGNFSGNFGCKLRYTVLKVWDLSWSKWIASDQQDTFTFVSLHPIRLSFWGFKWPE